MRGEEEKAASSSNDVDASGIAAETPTLAVREGGNKRSQGYERKSLASLPFTEEATEEGRATWPNEDLEKQHTENEKLPATVLKWEYQAKRRSGSPGPASLHVAEEFKEEERVLSPHKVIEKRESKGTDEGHHSISYLVSNVTANNKGQRPTQLTPGAVAVRGPGIVSALSENTNDSWIEQRSPAIDRAPLPSNAVEEGNIQEAVNATLVDETSTVVLANATAFDTEAEEKALRRRRMITILVSCGIASLVAIVAVVVSVKLSQGKSGSSNTQAPTFTFAIPTPNPSSITPTSNPSTSILPSSLTPTSSPTAITLFDFLTKNSFDDGAALSKSGSAQQLALDWLEKSQAASQRPTTDTILLETYALATLYYATTGSSWTSYSLDLNSDSTSWLRNAFDYCSWGGVDCIENESGIRSLDLIDNNLFGYIPAEIAYLSSLGKFHKLQRTETCTELCP